MPTAHHELAHAKLTRYLRIAGRRSDGYHLLDTEMVTVDLCDELEISDGTGLVVEDQIEWAGDGVGTAFSVPADDDNLVVRALRLAQRTAHVRLVKHIPAGAGLGGGSADAAAILRWAKVHDLEGAASLGADVPFCLAGGHARVAGIGEQLTALGYEERCFVLVIPDLVVSTADVYRAYDEIGRGSEVEQSGNDLEAAAIVVEPRLRAWRDLVAHASGHRPVMAGSGSTWFVETTAERADDLARRLLDAVMAEKKRGVIRVCRETAAIAY